MAAAELVECSDIDLEGSVFPGVPFDDLENFRRHLLGVIPVLLVPLLEHTHRRPGDLHIQFNIFGDARQGEVRRADQGERADHFLPGRG